MSNQENIEDKKMNEARLKYDIFVDLMRTRKEPGLPLEEIAKIMTEVFSADEFEALILGFRENKK